MPGTTCSQPDGGKKKSQFIRKEDVKAVRIELANYRLLRELTNEWIGLSILLAQINLKNAS